MAKPYKSWSCILLIISRPLALRASAFRFLCLRIQFFVLELSAVFAGCWPAMYTVLDTASSDNAATCSEDPSGISAAQRASWRPQPAKHKPSLVPRQCVHTLAPSKQTTASIVARELLRSGSPGAVFTLSCFRKPLPVDSGDINVFFYLLDLSTSFNLLLCWGSIAKCLWMQYDKLLPVLPPAFPAMIEGEPRCPSFLKRTFPGVSS